MTCYVDEMVLSRLVVVLLVVLNLSVGLYAAHPHESVAAEHPAAVLLHLVAVAELFLVVLHQATVADYQVVVHLKLIVTAELPGVVLQLQLVVAAETLLAVLQLI